MEFSVYCLNVLASKAKNQNVVRQYIKNSPNNAQALTMLKILAVTLWFSDRKMPRRCKYLFNEPKCFISQKFEFFQNVKS